MCIINIEIKEMIKQEVNKEKKTNEADNKTYSKVDNLKFKI